MLRGFNTLVLSDEELAHVVACLGRVDDDAGFPHSLDFYARLHRGMNGRAATMFERYYRHMTFSKTRAEKIGGFTHERTNHPSS